ncbi:platelet glycoprotein Ib alpha chain [Tachysurus vachellii]|uniref:platelet glycoprotein Ib alpha chain n=1 Tax=Tachysurus vachellii TaxID=175792 RepID=UPI00296AAA79|nr:platelet glycoprotein Ib alpha chain [Tachysurus vachellii]
MLLFLFLLMSQHSMVTTISGCHSDLDKDHRPRVSCVSQGLTAVPDGIDNETQVLVLSQNMFVSLSWAAYTNFTHLHELDLSQNLISTIERSGPVLKNLQVLRLSNNMLTSLGRATFNSTPSLMEVYLDGNTISSIDNATFSDLPLLELINLSYNKLHILPTHLLEHISSSTLKEINLEENYIQQIPDNFFASKPEIPYIFLSNNSWVCTCQVGYLKQYLFNQSENIYIHTALSGVTSDAESVVCSAPLPLQGRAVIDLMEEEYCGSDNESHHSISTTAKLMSAPTTALTSIPPNARKTTTPSTAESSTTPTLTTTTNKPMPITTTEPTTPISTLPTSSQTTTPKSSTPTTTEKTAPTTTPKSSTPATTEKTAPTTTPKSSTPATTEKTAPTTTPKSSTPATTEKTAPTTTPKSSTPATTEKTAPTTTPKSSTPATTEKTAPTTTPKSSTPATTEKTAPTTTPKSSTSATTEKTAPTTTPKTAESSTASISITLTTNNPTTFKAVTMVTQPAGGVLSAHGQRSVMWCWWLFITVLLLCIFSAIFSCMLLLWLVIIYITLYQPIKKQVQTGQRVSLRVYKVTADESVDTNEAERVMFLPPDMIRETQPVFRSVLFVSKGAADGETGETREGTRNEDEEKKIRTDTGTKIDLLPEATLHREQEMESNDREEVFRKTLYRVINREEEIDDWKEVEENCWGMTEKDKGSKEGGVERKRYSLILREERGSVVEGRKGEMEWLVGEWEMRRGQEIWGSLIRMKEGCGLSDSTHMDPSKPVAEISV